MKRSIKLSALQTLLTLAGVVAAAGAAQAGTDTTRVIVAMKPGAAAGARAAVVAAKGVVKHEIMGMNAMAVEVPTAALKGLAHNPNVEYVEEDVKRYPFAVSSPSTGTPYALGQKVPYGIAMVQADQLSDALAGNRKICIIDSGYDRAHEDLAKDADVTGEYDAGTGWWYTDENSHGTHVAGTIAALNNAGTGVVGVMANGNIKLHIVKVFGADGWAYSSTLATAANKCKAAGANIISMSWGSRSNKTEQKAFDQILAAGILPIAAAGNDGTTAKSYPAAYASVVSVAAIDENKAWASFSQYNSEVEIAGPGVAVLSTVPTGTGKASTLNVAAAPTTRVTWRARLAEPHRRPLQLWSGRRRQQRRGRQGLPDPARHRGLRHQGHELPEQRRRRGRGLQQRGWRLRRHPGHHRHQHSSVTASDTEGAAMLGQLGQSATVAIGPSNYAAFDGTSMATPHVSAVAALVWSRNLGCTAAQLRNSLNKSAEDLGTAGRDTKFGFGLVRAKAADDRIKSLGCGN